MAKITIAQRHKEIHKFIEDLKTDTLFKKYIYEHTWLSGSSTYVTPITIWNNEIELQWKSNKRIFDKFIQRYVEKYPDLISYGTFWKTDGSCPSTITFYLTDKYKYDTCNKEYK